MLVADVVPSSPGGETGRPSGGRQPAAPTLNAPAVAAVTPSSLTDFVRYLDDVPLGSDIRAEFDRRLIRVLSGDYAEAREPIPGAPAEMQRAWKGVIDMVIAAREGHPGDVDAMVDELQTSMLGVGSVVEALSDLRVPRFALCSRVTGFGQYEPLAAPVFTAGRIDNEFVAYAEIADFVSEQDAQGRFVSRFSVRIAILDGSGKTMHEVRAEDLKDVAQSKRHDCFVAPVIQLPASLSAGEYVAKITVSDKIGSKVAEARTSLRLQAR